MSDALREKYRFKCPNGRCFSVEPFARDHQCDKWGSSNKSMASPRSADPELVAAIREAATDAFNRRPTRPNAKSDLLALLIRARCGSPLDGGFSFRGRGTPMAAGVPDWGKK
jgi:hypothetical protein